MELINNTTKTLKDDLSVEIKQGSKLSIAAACFSIYAFQELKEQLSQIEELRFIFTSPTFVTEKAKKERREFYIPRLTRERNLYGTEFEIKLRNELTQKAIARECAEWIRQKVTFKSNVSDKSIQGQIVVDGVGYTPINNFTTVELGCEKGNVISTTIVKDESLARTLLADFNEIWNDSKVLQVVTDEVIDSITAAYNENSPDFIYFVTLYNLLSDDGLIVISIDDNEYKNMRNICDEVLGECNFVACVVWQKIHSIKNDAKYFSENHEYALIYAKSIDKIKIHLLPRTDEMNSRYKNPDNDPRGPWQSGDLVASGERSNGHFFVTSPKTRKQFDVPQGKHWVYSQDNLMRLVEDNQVWFGEDGNSFPRKKRFLSDVQDGRTPNTLWLAEEVGHNQTATRELKALFDDEKCFDFPKPVAYIEQFVRVVSDKDSVVLDFFSGSATTAHAVMQLNAEDGGHRKFIMVQLPEKCDEKSEAYKAGYRTICEIGKERIRRAGAKIKEEAGLAAQNLDTGFRVLKCDTSNMKDVYYNPAEYEVNMFSRLEDNIKEDRTPEDLLFQVMLDLGVLLSSKIEETTIAGKKVFNVEDNYLIACFDSDVSEETIKAIAKQKPYYFVMRDSSMASDSVATNFDQIFATYSPDTVRKVL